MDANESDSEDLLNDLLANVEEDNEEVKAENEVEKTSEKPKTLKELNFNFIDSVSDDTSNKTQVVNDKNASEVYDDKIDSSDDEDRRYFEEQNYSTSGRELKHLLKRQNAEKQTHCTNQYNNKSIKSNDTIKKAHNLSVPTTNNSVTKDVYADPFFGIKIITPLVSSAELKERMVGRIAVTVSKVKNHVMSEDLQNDWVFGGIIINMSDTKKSQKGTSYSIWKVSDLSENMNSISVFLFSAAHKSFWKTTVGTVIGILNPNVLNAKDNNGEVSLSVDNAQKIMILGKSRDMGKCKSVKKNGDPCTAIVNLSRCEYCVYHVKQEYKKCSRRVELQTSTDIRRFASDPLPSKTRQKSRATLPGMQPFVPVFAKRNDKLHAKDRERLALLSGNQNLCEKSKTSKPNVEMPRKGQAVELTTNQMRKDYDRLNKLRGWKTEPQVVTQMTSSMTESSSLSLSKSSSPLEFEEKKKLMLDSNAKLGNNSTVTLNSQTGKGLAGLKSSLQSEKKVALPSPQLGKGCRNGTIDFSQPITKTHIDKAKINAIKWIQQNGKIKAKDPNKIRVSKEERIVSGVKRVRETEEEEQIAKKAKGLNEKFKEMLEKTSSHTDLIENSQEEEKEKYFNKLEMKERMEEKMMTTFKVNCKAVKCITCKYVAFSASDLCKEQRHPLRVFDAVKRFFKCSDCGNRTVSLDKMPSHSCTKCNSSSWVRAAMMDEKKTEITGATLSIRGGEEKFLGSMVKDANLNLLVPDTA